MLALIPLGRRTAQPKTNGPVNSLPKAERGTVPQKETSSHEETHTYSYPFPSLEEKLSTQYLGQVSSIYVRDLEQHVGWSPPASPSDSEGRMGQKTKVSKGGCPPGTLEKHWHSSKGLGQQMTMTANAHLLISLPGTVWSPLTHLHGQSSFQPYFLFLYIRENETTEKSSHLLKVCELLDGGFRPGFLTSNCLSISELIGF